MVLLGFPMVLLVFPTVFSAFRRFFLAASMEILVFPLVSGQSSKTGKITEKKREKLQE